MNYHLLQNNEIGISFPYDTTLIQKVKSLSKRRWDVTSKQWICPLDIAPEIQILFDEIIEGQKIDKEAIKELMR